MGLVTLIAGVAAIKGAAKVVKNIQDKNSVEGIIERSNATYKLIANANLMAVFEKMFYITDESGVKKYKIKTDNIRQRRPKSAIYDMQGNELARIETELIHAKGTFEPNTYIHPIYLHGERISSAVPIRVTSLDYDLGFDGLRYITIILKSSFEVKNREGKTISRARRSLQYYDHYVLEYWDKKDEAIALISVMLHEITMVKKSDYASQYSIWD